MQILPILLIMFSFILHSFVQYLLQCNEKKYPSMVGGRGGGGVVTKDTNVYCCPAHHTQSQTFKSPGFLFFSLFKLRFHPRVCSSLRASCCMQRGPGSLRSGRAVSRDKSFPRVAESRVQIQTKTKSFLQGH